MHLNQIIIIFQFVYKRVLVISVLNVGYSAPTLYNKRIKYVISLPHYILVYVPQVSKHTLT